MEERARIARAYRDAMLVRRATEEARIDAEKAQIAKEIRETGKATTQRLLLGDTDDFKASVHMVALLHYAGKDDADALRRKAARR